LCLSAFYNGEYCVLRPFVEVSCGKLFRCINQKQLIGARSQLTIVTQFPATQIGYSPEVFSVAHAASDYIECPFQSWVWRM
jgi:hypothetical protein